MSYTQLIRPFRTQLSRSIYVNCSLAIVLGTFAVGAEESDRSQVYLNLRDLESTDAFNQEVERFAKLFNEAQLNAELRLKDSGLTINNPKKSFYSHPTTLRFILPFKWIGVSDQIPISLLTDGTHLEGKTPYLNPSSILTRFNIRLVSQLDNGPN